MKLNNIIQTIALLGALGTSGVASADHWRDDHNRNDSYAEQDDSYSLDVIGQKTLRERGTVTFKIKPEMRRDGLQLVTDGARVRVSRIDFIYSDGRIVPVKPARSLREGRLFTVQVGRPPGLRKVRVSYQVLSYDDYRPSLALVQMHTGDGYTHEEDLWKNHENEGYYNDDDVQTYRFDRGAWRRGLRVRGGR